MDQTPPSARPQPHEPRRDISPERQAAYYLGMGLAGIGILLFLSAAVFGPDVRSGFDQFHRDMQSAGLRAVFGMVLIAVGGIVAGIGAKGLAGSGIVLDPKKSREDLEPWNRMAGGMLDDTLSEVGVVKKLEERLGDRAPAVKIRCRQCQALNDETAKFCNQCGAAL